MLDLNEVKYTLRKNWPLKDLSNKKVICQAIKAKRVLKTQKIDSIAIWSDNSHKGETLTLQTLIKVSNDKGAESRRITAGNGNLLHNQ